MNHIYREGDTVIAYNPGGYAHLTHGKGYQILSIKPNGNIVVENDDQILREYSLLNFEKESLKLIVTFNLQDRAEIVALSQEVAKYLNPDAMIDWMLKKIDKELHNEYNKIKGSTLPTQ